MARSVEIKIAGWAGLMAGMHSKRWILLLMELKELTEGKNGCT
jgi:hypothetical protein